MALGAANMVTLEAVVGPGRQLASLWMKEDDFIAEALGVELCPGSLNLYVAGEEHHVFGQGVHAKSLRQRGFVEAIRCTVGGHDAFILNTDPRTADTPTSPIPRPFTMFEVFSKFHLRTALGLNDGSPVKFAFDRSRREVFRPDAGRR